MNLGLPWIKARKIVISSLLVDMISIFLLYIFINQVIKDKALDISVHFIIFPIIWITSSYVIGRFHNKWRKASEYLTNLLQTVIVTIISYSLFYLILISFNSSSILLGFNILLRYSFLASIVCSFSLQSIFSLFRKNKLSSTNNVIFICSEEFSKNIKSLKRFDINNRNNINYIVKTEDYLLSDQILNKKNLIVVSEPNKLNEKIQEKLTILQDIGYSIDTLLSWSERVLECFPSSILTRSNIIKGDFKIRRNSFQFRLKRIGDFIFSIFILIISSPITIFVAILIKFEDGGPIFYSQKRTGLKGKEFKIYKLRSMKKDAESNKALWSKENDPRVTRIGRFIRHTRIDELPQLWCVINGQMSLIGPRPERPEMEVDLVKDINNYKLRYSIRPGLSGWAQVKYKYGNSIYDSEIKLSYDLYYLRNFSFWLDVLIMFKTIRLVFNSSRL